MEERKPWWATKPLIDFEAEIKELDERVLEVVYVDIVTTVQDCHRHASQGWRDPGARKRAGRAAHYLAYRRDFARAELERRAAVRKAVAQ